MPRWTRRHLLTGLASASIASIAGCSEALDQAPVIGTSEEEELREKWEENDDYPEDDFRNFNIGRRDLGMFTGTDGRIETTFGYHVEILRLGVSEDYYRSTTLEVHFESSKSVDVYIIPGDVSADFLDNRDLSEYEHVPEYSEFGTDRYREVLETSQEEKIYTMIVTLADFHPPQTIEEEAEFTLERDEAVLDGWMETAAYVPFEDYLETEAVRGRYDFESENGPLSDD